MDINIVRGIMTTLLFIVFLVGCYVVFRKSSQAVFDAAARMPLEEDDDEFVTHKPKEAGND